MDNLKMHDFTDNTARHRINKEVDSLIETLELVNKAGKHIGITNLAVDVTLQVAHLLFACMRSTNNIEKL